MRQLAIAALCLVTACARHDDIRPADVPRLARLDESGESVWMTTVDGTSIEVSRYKEVRLYPEHGAGGYLLRRPIRVREWEGRLWLRSGDYRPIPFDPHEYSRAVLVHSDRGNIPMIVIGSALGAFVLAVVIQTSATH